MFYFFWSVPGSRYCSRYFCFFGFNDKRRNTYRSDFVRYQAATWKQPCVAFRGQGDAAVRQIASMNDSYGYTIVNCVCPHVMVRPWKAGNYLRNRYLARFRIIRMALVFGIIIKETRESPASSDAITTLGLIKLFLYYVCEIKVSNHHGLAK